MTDSTHGPDEARRRPHAGSDETSELPVVGSPGPRADQPGDRTLDLGKQPQARQAQGTAAYGAGQPAPAMTQRPYGRVGNEPVPGPYGGSGPLGARVYGALLPSLAAGLVAALIAVVPGVMDRNGARPTIRARLFWDLWGHASFYDAVAYQRYFGPRDNGSLIAAGLVLLVGVFLLVLLTLVTVRASAARGLLVLAVWGAVAIAGQAAAVVAALIAGQRGLDVLTYADLGAGFGVRFGWLPGLAAAALRVGRRRQP